MDTRPKYINEYRKFGDTGAVRRGNGKSYLDHLVIQCFVSLVIVALVLFLNNIKSEVTKSITQGIKATISWHVDVGKTVDTFKHFKSMIPAAASKAGQSIGKEATDSLALEKTAEFIMPIEGSITSAFGMRAHPVFKTTKMHNGIDIEAKIGTPFKASMAGKVTKVGKDNISGKFVIISNNTYETMYAHCIAVMVKEGQTVQQGDTIGETGDTGVVSGPHLHFEILKDGKPVNPLEVMQLEKLQ